MKGFAACTSVAHWFCIKMVCVTSPIQRNMRGQIILGAATCCVELCPFGILLWVPWSYDCEFKSQICLENDSWFVSTILIFVDFPKVVILYDILEYCSEKRWTQLAHSPFLNSVNVRHTLLSKFVWNFSICGLCSLFDPGKSGPFIIFTDNVTVVNFFACKCFSLRGQRQLINAHSELLDW